MTLDLADTVVTYPDGALTSTGTVLHVRELADGRTGVILDTTAFHPVDTAWPDQPADRGYLSTPSGDVEVVDAVTGGLHEGELFVGADLPVRTGAPGWSFVVVHVLEAGAPALGDVVTAHIDADYRHALSAAHTACHLAALALDEALAGAWTKTVAVDAAGNPAFDSLAIQTSRIDPRGSTDVYRIGKSLRKKGFDAAALEDSTRVAQRVNETLRAWVETKAAVRVVREATALTARREWQCDLPDGTVSLACGGTHVTSLAEVAAVTVTLDARPVEGGVELTMATRVVPAR